MREWLVKFGSFLKQAFSENGNPSSSRLLSAWLSISSMALIWWMVRHIMMEQDGTKIIAWIGGIPAIIYALATFAVSPYGLGKITNIWKKDDPAKG